MKKWIFSLAACLLFHPSFSQVAINETGADADSSAVLDVQSTNKGLLVPRLTTKQQIDIYGPSAGLVIFNTDSADFYGYNGTVWQSFSDPGDTIENWDCGMMLTDTRDSKTYETVYIDGKCWMAENLNVGTMITDTSRDNGIIEKYCYLDNSSFCSSDGGLYSWDEMMQYSTDSLVQGICPPGWHVPTSSDWCSMTSFVDTTVSCTSNTWDGTDVGTKLKSTSGWAGGNGTDEVGFSGRPGGFQGGLGNYFNYGTDGYWWSTGYEGSGAWSRRLSGSHANIGYFSNYKFYALSVRCVMD